MTTRVAALAFAALAAAPAPASGPSGVSHRLDLRFDEVRRVLRIEGEWRLPPSAEAIDTWSFYLSAKMRDLAVGSVRCGSSRRRALQLTPSEEGGDTRWSLRLDRPCPAGRRLRMRFAYRVGEDAPQLRIAADSGFAGGGGELWYPQRAFSDRETAFITLDLPARLTGIASGELVRRSSRAGRSRLQFASRSPGKLAFAFGPYRDAGLLRPYPIRVLTRGDAAAAREIAARLAALLAPLEEAFGAAPQRSLALVEVDFGGSVRGTGEYGMIFANPEDMRAPFDAAYWAHEFGHQWWGNMVRSAPGTAGASLLTEGFAEYGAILAIEASQGAEAGARYRAGALERYVRLAAAGHDRALAGPAPRDQAEVLHRHRLATSKGAILLRQLAELVGRNRFHAVLRGFLRRFAGSAASWDDLEQALHAETGGAFRWWADQWLRRPGAPRLRIDHSISGRTVTLELRQAGEPYRLSVPVELRGGWGRERVLIETSSAYRSVAHQAGGPVESVVVDPDALIPRLPMP